MADIEDYMDKDAEDNGLILADVQKRYEQSLLLQYTIYIDTIYY